MGKGYPAPKAQRIENIRFIAIIHARTAEEFNAQSEKILKYEDVKPLEMAQFHHVEDGIHITQRWVQDDKTAEGKLITKLTSQKLIMENSASEFNKKVMLALEDNWEFIGYDPMVKYNADAKGFVFSIILGKGESSNILLPYGKAVIAPGYN